MFRSLHMKLVLIMVLLIISLMTVVGAFLMNSVVNFYLEDFHQQMYEIFHDDVEFIRDLTEATDGEEAGYQMIEKVLSSNMGGLGVDGRNRNYYILDGNTGAFLAGSNEEAGSNLEITLNITTALGGKMGEENDVTADYMDVAVPIQRGGVPYIIYIRDNRQAVQSLNSALFTLIMQALIFGLVISVLLSFLLAKTMITPIERLTDGAKRVAAGDFSRKIEVGSRDEIGVLTATFNHMARQLEETLREVENERNKLDTLFLHMTDGVVAFNREGTIIHANPAAAEMLGEPVSVGCGVDYAILFGQIAQLEAVLQAEQPGFLEGEMDRDGKSLELLLAPFDRANQAGVLVVIHDITQQRRTEEMRREFVANVSHELRTPLTNIRSYAETLADNPDMPPEMEHNFLHVILNESDRMTHIVQDLLTLSRFDSGRGELLLGKFSFEGAIRDIYNAVVLDAQHHGHTLELRMEPDIPQIVGDRDRVLQVMMNVVSNAIKYTPDGGYITISAGQAEDRVWMEVADNGIGIPKEDRPRIFERFYRVDKARSRESGGTGLGLSIAKEIIDRHGGGICLADRDTPGTTIRIELNIEGPSHGI